MKTYPSIPRSVRGRKATRRLHLFDKLDGSNLRFEWSRRDGWTRFGTRHRVIDEHHPIFGSGMELFRSTLAEPIARVATDQGWDALVAFGEFWGSGSLGGQHEPEAPKRITLFDVAPHRRGLLGRLFSSRSLLHTGIPGHSAVSAKGRVIILNNSIAIRTILHLKSPMADN